MLKKLTTFTAATVFALTMGMAHAAPATETGPVELTSAEMDNVSAGGWHKKPRKNRRYRIRGSRASANAVATANGPGARAASFTATYVENSFADASASSYSSIQSTKRPSRCGRCK